MHAVVLPAPGEITVVDVPDPVACPGEVVVEVARTGVCGTDLHIVAGEFPPTPYPITPGHEFSGTVVALGAGVGAGTSSDTGKGTRTGAGAEIAVGDRVAVDPSIYCGHCRYCRAGRGNLCEHWNAVGDTVDGAFAQYVAVSAANCYVMPESMTFAQGAFVEPVSCAVHGVRRLGVESGERILVVGAGSMGLVVTQLLNAAGAQVTVVDRVEGKLPRASELGAVQTATSTAGLDRLEFDAAVDVTGAAPAIADAFDALGRGGRLQIFGVAPADARVPISPFRVYNDEITIVGTMAVLNSFGSALDLVARGVVDADAILSHTYPLADFAAAIDMVTSGQSLKVQISAQG